MSRVLIIGKGYVGSALYKHLQWYDHYHNNAHAMDWHDDSADLYNDFNRLSPQTLEHYSDVILLAGNSSVKSCHDLYGTFDANVAAYVNLLHKLPYKTRLIYASSASVYGSNGTVPALEDRPFDLPANYYDMSKQMLDTIASISGRNYIGLRFGTVCGHSPKPRHELIINSLVKSAKETGVMHVANIDSYRAVLGLGDLCRGVKAILDTPDAPPGFYNMRSVEGSIYQLAKAVQRCLALRMTRPEIQFGPNSSTYSFTLNVDKFERTFDYKFTDTVADIVEGALKNLA